MTVGQIYEIINSVAPFHLAEQWDNSGLIVGDYNNQVRKIIFAIDITTAVVKEAIEKSADLIISHHPVIFKPLNSLTQSNPAVMLANSGISAICAHTNLDIANGGLNDELIKRLELIPTDRVLHKVAEKRVYSLSVFVPKNSVTKVYDAMKNAGAGEYDEYSGCAFFNEGIGVFTPLDGANPTIGKVGEFETVDECRIEMFVTDENKDSVIAHMLEAHPYEVPAYNLFENIAKREILGCGRICVLENEMSCSELATRIKDKLGNKVVRFNDTGKMIKKVAVCSGSGAKYFASAISFGADAYITGDIEHDKFVDASNLGLAMFDAGHYQTERIFSYRLIELIREENSEIELIEAESGQDILSYLCD